MNIGFDGKRALHNLRGLGNYSRTLIAGLERYFPDHNYFLFSPTPSNNLDERVSDFLRAHKNLKLITPGGLFSLSESLWRSLLLQKEIASHHLDIYHGLSHELPPELKQSKTLYTVTMHDLIFMRYPQFFPWIDRQVYKLKYQNALKQAHKVIAICEQTKGDLVNLLGADERKIVVSYQACDPQFYQTYNKEESERVLQKYKVKEPFILYVGAFEENKNVLGLLEAASQVFLKLKGNADNLKLVLIGRGKNYKKLMLDKIEKLKMENRVLILENLAHRELPHFYQQAQCLVFPSFFEGFGLPVVEALSSGCPVVTSEGGCFPESGGPGSSYVDPKRPESIAEAILQFLESEEKRQKARETGLNYVQRFHLSKTSAHIMEIYQSMIKDR